MNEIIEHGKQVLKIESMAILRMIDSLNDDFVKVVELMEKCKGRVVITGMGKSGLIGKKIAATLSSIGTATIFLHPAEGIHGDLGMIVPGDLVIAISNSGETEEIVRLMPQIKGFNVQVVAMVGNVESALARMSDFVLDISVKEEACPLNLVPTASTTATLAMGDAVAIALLRKKGITPGDFAVFHPGGSLGKRLLTKVENIMKTGAEIPIVKEEVQLKDVIYTISSKKLGVACVVDKDGALTGIITDGDLRRLMEEKGDVLFNVTAVEMMSKNPKTIAPEIMATKAVYIMEKNSITSLVVTYEDKKPVGIIHLHDLLKAGIM